jgi:hypothetical protein
MSPLFCLSPVYITIGLDWMAFKWFDSFAHSHPAPVSQKASKLIHLISWNILRAEIQRTDTFLVYSGLKKYKWHYVAKMSFAVLSLVPAALATLSLDFYLIFYRIFWGMWSVGSGLTALILGYFGTRSIRHTLPLKST